MEITNVVHNSLCDSLIILTLDGRISWERLLVHPSYILDIKERYTIIEGEFYQAEIYGKLIFVSKLTHNLSYHSFMLGVSDMDRNIEMKIKDKSIVKKLYETVHESCSHISQWLNSVVEAAPKIKDL